MLDNTRVNEFQDKLLQAMNILNSQALKTISYDQTILCTIVDNSENKQGKYLVTDSSKTFTAYSNDTRLHNQDQVYVTIPQGDFENQKMIVGKKTVENDKPFVFTTPFDTLFDMTDNVTGNKISQSSLIANALNKYGNDNYEYVTIYDQPCDYYGYTRLGFKADFKTWIKNAVKGNYGVVIVLTAASQNTTFGKELETKDYHYKFSNKEMYGNSYDFETNYEQQLVFSLEQIKGTIINIKINFYQEANFFDKFNEPLPCSSKGFKIKTDGSNLYEKDEDNNYLIYEDDALLEPNIFLENVYMCFGHDISRFDTDMVEIYTQQSNTYKHSNSSQDDGVLKNKKIIKTRWIHLDENGNPIDMIKLAEKETSTTPYEIRWYKYKIGAQAADPYCGVYWTRIENASGFTYEFYPDIDLQQEKIKVIIIYNSNTPYRSNELYFENEEDLPPSESAKHIANALTIVADDGTNGNYLIYGQDNSIKDTEYGKTVRSLSAMFDTNNNGELENNEKIVVDDAHNLLWFFPSQNTMLELLNEAKEPVMVGSGDDAETIGYYINTHAPLYRISSYYSPNKTNNTVTCQYSLNNRVYKTEKEFTFGPAGTMGSEQTLVIDLAGDAKSVIINNDTEDDEIVMVQIQLYNNQNTLQSIPAGSVEWSWYYNSKLEQTNENVQFPYKIEGQTDSVLVLEKSQLDINHLYILQGTVGNLTTYFPIPIQNGEYSYIKGPTQVIYQSNGEPAYNREPYFLYTEAEGPQIDVKWKIIEFIDNTNDEAYNQQKKFIGQLSEDKKLQPLAIYTKDAPIYGVQAYTNFVDKDGNTQERALWTQPILVLQNQWPNGVINAWDGKTLILDEESSMIISAAIAAGKKNNDDNTFSGVMLGNWEGKDAEDSITEQTGVYGFHHGAMSYAFKEDGTAFIGKSSMARINFDGNESTIYSAGYNTSVGGMMINLYNGGEPYIDLQSKETEEGIKSSMRFDTKNSGSTIYMQNGKNNQYIQISNNNTTTPLKIGNNFDVDWSGNIRASGGSIGNWNILDSGALESNDEKITLNTETGGSIQVGNGTNSKITISANDGTNDTGCIKIGGKTTLGYVEANTAGWGDKEGVGLIYKSDSNTAIIQTTGSNAGLKYNSNYITTETDNISIGVLTNEGRIELKLPAGGGSNDSYKGALHIYGNTNKSSHITVHDIPAENQHGIYARFA